MRFSADPSLAANAGQATASPEPFHHDSDTPSTETAASQNVPAPSALARPSDAVGNLADPYQAVVATRDGDGDQSRAAALRSATDQALVAPVDPSRLFTAQVSFEPAAVGGRCVVGGRDALCGPLLDGPLVLTDFVAMGDCPDDLFLGSAPGVDKLDPQLRSELNWVVPVRQTGGFGASFYVPGGSRLVSVVRPAAKALSFSPNCALTYSGFRPRMVPTRASR